MLGLRVMRVRFPIERMNSGKKRKFNLVDSNWIFCWWDKPIIAILGLVFQIFWVLNKIKNGEIENQQVFCLNLWDKKKNKTESRLWAPASASVSLAGGHSLVERRHTPATFQPWPYWSPACGCSLRSLQVRRLELLPHVVASLSSKCRKWLQSISCRSIYV